MRAPARRPHAGRRTASGSYPFLLSKSFMKGNKGVNPLLREGFVDRRPHAADRPRAFRPSMPAAFASFANFSSSLRLGSRNVTFISDRLSFSAWPL